MHVPEIIEVKDHLEKLKNDGFISKWELPYENILTRRSAAIFFMTPSTEERVGEIANELNKYENFSFRPNSEKKLSTLEYRITFDLEEKEKNEDATL